MTNMWMVHFQDEKVKVSKLEDKVRELEDVFCETQRECEKKTEVSNNNKKII